MSKTTLEIRYNDNVVGFHYETFTVDPAWLNAPIILQVLMDARQAAPVPLKLFANGVLLTRASVTRTMSADGIFASLPIYLGSRGGTSLRFAGSIFDVLALGKVPTDVERTGHFDYLSKLIRTLP
jgi:hypothetical protein